MVAFTPADRCIRYGPVLTERSLKMTWTSPEIKEVCVGMEITSYESAEI